MFDPLSYQVELEQLFEDLKQDTPDIVSANEHLTRIGRFLLIGQEFLTSDEYQAALRYCGLTEFDAAFSIEVCQYACGFQLR